MLAEPQRLRQNSGRAGNVCDDRVGVRSWKSTMVFDHIEKVKQEYTDKYVVVDGERPELARFRDHVGQVRTVNMSGRALVEFIDYHLNIGWYDIDLDYLKVVDKPEPAEKKPAAKKPAAKKAAPKAAPSGDEKKLSPLEMARMQGAATKQADKPKSESAAPAAPATSEKAKPAGGKMSTADILAAARGGASKPAPALEDPAPAEEPAGQTTEESIELEDQPVSAEPSSAPAEKVDKSSMSIDDMLAWCRQHDSN